MLALAAELLVAGFIIGATLAISALRYLQALPLMHGDYAKHFEYSASLHGALSSAPGLWGKTSAAMAWMVDYPPLTYLWTSLLFWRGGPSEASAHLGQLFWLALLLVTTYVAVRGWWGRTAATVALLLCASSIVTAEATSRFSPDLAVAATSFTALCLLARAHELEDARWALATGLFAGLGLLCKWSAAFYLALPAMAVVASCLLKADWRGRLRFGLLAMLLGACVVAACLGARAGPAAAWAWPLLLGTQLAFITLRLLARPSDRPLRNAMGAILTTWVMCAPYYAMALSLLLGRLDSQVRGPMSNVPWEILQTLLASLAVTAVPGLLLLLPVGTMLVLLRRDRCPLSGLSLLALIGGLSLTVLARLQDFRYYAPLVPMAVVLCVGWIAGARSWIRVPLVAVLVTAGLVQGAFLTMAFPDFPTYSTRLAPYVRPYSAFSIRFRGPSGEECPDEALVRARQERVLERAKVLLPPGPSSITVVRDEVNLRSQLYSAEVLQTLEISGGQPVAIEEYLFDGRSLRPRLPIQEALWSLLRMGDRYPGHPYTSTPLPPDVVLVVVEPRSADAATKAIAEVTGRSWSPAGAFALPGKGIARVLAPAPSRPASAVPLVLAHGARGLPRRAVE